MASPRTLALCGIDRRAEAGLKETFEAAARRCGVPWLLAGEGEADALLIDIDSMYGQMSYLKAQGGSRPIVALTAAARADADFLLPREFTVEALAGVLSMLSERIAARPDPQPIPLASPPPAELVRAKPAEPVQAAAPPPPEPEPVAEAEPPRPRQLLDALRLGRLPGPVRLRDSQPELLVDAVAGHYLAGPALKPLLPLAAEALAEERWEAISPHEYDRQEARLGARQPLSRLLWLAGLAAGGGQLLAELAAAQRFKLAKYPQTEREFPRHIRIATAMLKQLSSVDEIAAASGSERGDVADFINACHALGLIETDQPAAEVSTETPRGGLLGRLRGKK